MQYNVITLIVFKHFAIARQQWLRERALMLRYTEAYSACIVFFFSPVVQRPNSGLGRFVVEVSGSHTEVISSLQWSLPTQQIEEVSIHTPSGIRTRDPSNRTAANVSLRLHDCWDRLA
jgi:hypothetical protein